MKAISLWQPWASLMADGLKAIETRPWQTGYRGPLAIHAAKRRMSVEEHGLLWDWQVEDLVPMDFGGTPFSLPFGAIIAVVELVDCRPTENLDPGLPEIEFGDFTEGRWAWITQNPRQINPPIPYRGQQGLFEIPDDILAGAAT